MFEFGLAAGSSVMLAVSHRHKWNLDDTQAPKASVALCKTQNNENSSFFSWKEQPTDPRFKLFFNPLELQVDSRSVDSYFVAWIGYHLPSQFDSLLCCFSILFTYSDSV